MAKCFCIVALVALSACGGRKAAPVEASRATDAELTCAHIDAEREVNAARVVDLTGESEFSGQNNVGLLLASPLFLDFSDTIQVEIKAIGERNSQLDKLSKTKGCS